MNARQIVQALGGHWHGSYGLALCPSHDDGKTPGLKITDAPHMSDGILAHCFGGCDFRNVKAALRAQGLLPDTGHSVKIFDTSALPPKPRELCAVSDDRNREFALSIWRECVPADGTPVETYLRSRGITIPVPASLRYHPNLQHSPTGLPFPAMVAGVQGADGQVVAIHRTYLLPDGRGKAGVSSPKMALGSLKGAAVRLAATTDTVTFIEGIEDGLSVLQLTRAPCWACLGTAGFLNIEIPERIKRVVLAPDNNEAGRAVIEPAGNRLADKGLSVEVARPPGGKDWNDLLHEYAERAAIMEHDGGANPQTAERDAWRDVLEGAR